jgi:hypothetical protein
MIADPPGLPTAGSELDAAIAHYLGRLRAEGKLDRFMRQEPRCRVCREDEVRLVVNKLLGYKPMGLSLADILCILEPVNEGRGKKNVITDDCLWVHSRRH